MPLRVIDQVPQIVIEPGKIRPEENFLDLSKFANCRISGKGHAYNIRCNGAGEFFVTKVGGRTRLPVGDCKLYLGTEPTLMPQTLLFGSRNSDVNLKALPLGTRVAPGYLGTWIQADGIEGAARWDGHGHGKVFYELVKRDGPFLQFAAVPYAVDRDKGMLVAKADPASCGYAYFTARGFNRAGKTARSHKDLHPWILTLPGAPLTGPFGPGHAPGEATTAKGRVASTARPSQLAAELFNADW